jgi:methylmalonyl-CoA mutase N-terminal domain/subunit
LVPHPYDPKRRDEAEKLQLTHLKEVKEKRDNQEVARLLKELKAAARKEEVNLIPHFHECAKAYATLQEMCDVLKEVFGEYRPVTI